MTFDPTVDPLAWWPRLCHRNEIRPLLEQRDRLAEDLVECARRNAALHRDLRRFRGSAGAALERLDSDLLREIRDLSTNAARSERRHP